MTTMNQKLTVALLGLALAQAASASIIATASGGGLVPCSGSDAGSGSLSLTCPASGGFASVLITASAPPLLPAPELTTTELSVTSAAGLFPFTLLIDVTSSGFVFPGGPLTAIATVNNPVGTDTGPFAMSVQADGNPPIPFPVCTGSCVQTLSGTAGPITSDSVHYALTFTEPNQSVDATIEIVGATTEPASLTLLLIGAAALLVRQTCVTVR